MKLTKAVQLSQLQGLFICVHINIIGVKVQCCEICSVRFHGVCLFFHSRSGSRLSGSGSAMCTSGEESSVEWSSAQLDTDEQPSLEEWLVRSKDTQLKSQMPQTNIRVCWSKCHGILLCFPLVLNTVFKMQQIDVQLWKPFSLYFDHFLYFLYY